MATTVKITETYDMKTTVNKLGLVGIHTPTIDLIKKMYPGLLKNHKFIRFVKCDVVGACASVLPADPLQVGVSSGDVAPEDMFNPILYTAVTNESFDTLVTRIYGLSPVASLGSVDGGEFRPTVGADDNFKDYYALLAESGKFRKVMPQAGFNIRNLVPLCHTIVSTYGNVGSLTADNKALAEDGETPIEVPDMDIPTIDDNGSVGTKTVTWFKGRSVKMPKFPIHVSAESLTDIPSPSVPKTHVLAMVLPPARLHEFWYRMRVTWYVRFENVCSALEAGNYSAFDSIGASARGANYSTPSRSLETTADMLDVQDASINKIMES